MDNENRKKTVIMNFLYMKASDKINLPYNFDTISTILRDNHNIFITRDNATLLYLKDCLNEFNENIDDIDMYIAQKYPASSLIKPKKKIEIDSSASEDESEDDSKSVEKKTVKKTRAPRKQAEKKVYDKEGQRYDTPSKEDSSRMYYESLYAENPDSEMATKWLIERGISLEEASQNWVEPTFEAIEKMVEEEAVYPITKQLKKEINNFFNLSRIPHDEITPKQIRQYLEKVFNKDLKDRKDEINDMSIEILEKYMNKEKKKEKKEEDSDEDSDEEEKKVRKTKTSSEKLKGQLIGKVPKLKELTKEEKEEYYQKIKLEDELFDINQRLYFLQGQYHLNYNSMESLIPQMNGEEIKNLKNKINLIVQRIKEVKQERQKILTKLEDYPIVLAFETNEKVKKPTQVSKIAKEFQKIQKLDETDILTEKEKTFIKEQRKLAKEQVEEEIMIDDKEVYIKNRNQRSEEKMIMNKANYYNRKNLPYYAFLSNFVLSPVMLAEDPYFEKIYKQYPDLSIEFRSDFKRLTTEQKYDFVKMIFDNKSLSEIHEGIQSTEAIYNGYIPEVLQKYVVENPVDCENVKRIIDDELTYNTMHYFKTISSNQTKPEEVVKIVINLLKGKTRCEFDSILENYTQSLVSEITKSVLDYNQFMSNVHKYQYDKQEEYVSKDEYLSSLDEEDQHLIQRLYLAVRVPVPIEYEEDVSYKYKPLEGQSILFAVDGKYSEILTDLAKTFNNEYNRKKIYEVIEIIENTIGNKKLNKDERKQLELDAINEEIKEGNIKPNIGKFLTNFIELYGSVDYIPKAKGTSGKYLKTHTMFKFENVDDLPPFLRESAYHRLRDAMIQIDIKKAEYINKQKEQNSILAQIQYELIKSEINNPRLIELINSLDIKQEIKAKILYFIEKREWNNIYIILEQAHPGRIKKVYDPLVYLGIQRNNRMMKNRMMSDQITKLEDGLPSMSEGLKKCLELQALHPWIKTGKEARYFIADVNNQSKFDLDEDQQLLFGKKVDDEILEDKNYYIPTNLFWKKYCTDNFIYTKGPTMCNLEYILKTYTSNSEQKYVLGLFDPEKQKELQYKLRVSESDEEKDKIKEQLVNTYKIFTEEDYKKQCEWIENNTINYGNYLKVIALDLNRHREVRDAVRSSTLEIIKKILNDLYINKNITSKTDQIVNREAFELEKAIYESTLDSSGSKKPIYVYYKILNNFVIFMDANSPLYNYSDYFRTLFITTYMKNYKTLINLSILEKMPEIYLLPNKKEFMSMYLKYINNLIEKSIRSVMSTFDNTVSKPTRPENSYPDFKKFLNIIVGKDELEKYKNICENYEQVSNPYVMLKQSNGNMYCLSQEQVANIINGRNEDISDIPLEIREKAEQLLVIDESEKDMFTRINIMRVEAARLAKEYFGELNYLQFFESLFGKEELDYSLIDNIVSRVEQYMNIEMNEKERELFVQQLFAESHKQLLHTVQMLVDKYWNDNKSVLNELLVKERLSREQKYGNNIKNLVEDRIERFEILKPMFEFIDNSVRVDDETIFDSVIDYISQYKVVMPPVEKEKATERETVKYLTSKNCHYCALSLQDKNIYKTYVLGEVKSEDRVIPTTYPVEFCGRECFRAFEYRDVSQDKLEGMKIYVLIGKLIEPYGNIEYMKKYIKKLGIVIPEDATFGQMYASLLIHPSFNFEILDAKYKETILDYRKEILHKIADYFKIDKKNTPEVIFTELKRDPEFFSMFINRVKLIGEPITVYENIRRQTEFKSFSPGCEVDDTIIRQYINDRAERSADYQSQGLDSIKDFSFDIFFSNFFKNFRECSYLTKSIKEVSIARGMQEGLLQLSEAFFLNQTQDIDTLVDLIASEMERGKYNLYLTKGFEEEEADRKARSDVKRSKIKEGLAIKADMFSKMTTKERIEGSTPEEKLQTLISKYNDVYIERKNIGKQIDSRFLMDDVINKLGIVLETSNVSVDTYKSLVHKVATIFIEKIVSLIQQREMGENRPLLGRRKKLSKLSEIDSLSVEIENLMNQVNSNMEVIDNNKSKIEENKEKINDYSTVKMKKDKLIPKFQELVDKLEVENNTLQSEIDALELDNNVLKETVEQKEAEIKEKKSTETRNTKESSEKSEKKSEKKLTEREKRKLAANQPTKTEENNIEKAVKAVMTSDEVKQILLEKLQDYMKIFPETQAEKLEKRVKTSDILAKKAISDRKASVKIVDYSSKSFVVIGDLTDIKAELKNLGGKVNEKLDINGDIKQGVVFPTATRQVVEEFINEYKSEPVIIEEIEKIEEKEEKPYIYEDEEVEEIERIEPEEEVKTLGEEEFENVRYELGEEEGYGEALEYNPEDEDEENKEDYEYGEEQSDDEGFF